MRRLFSTFARGWPGTGLLLLRLVVGFSLVIHGVGRLRSGLLIGGTTLELVWVGDGILLIVGLWTPIAGSLEVFLAIWNAIAEKATLCPCILLAAIGAALVLLGPGGWSLDARFFGWKRIDIRR